MEYKDDTEPVRSVYDGDISTTLLDKLGAYYVDHYTGDLFSRPDYFIVRRGQYDYALYVGDIASDGTISGTADFFRYYGVTSGGYGLDYYVASSTATGTVDVTGQTGYIYSSHAEFLPCPYIVSHKTNNAGLLCSVGLTLLVCTVAIICGIRRWFNCRIHGR